MVGNRLPARDRGAGPALSAEGEAILGHVREELSRVVASRTIVPEVRIDAHPAAPEVRVQADNVVNVPAPVVNVVVDMAPIALAQERLAAAFEAAAARIAEKVAGAVARAIAEALAELPAPEVTVEAPQVTVQQPERPKRTVRIRHSDGSEDTVSEE
jgi:hypothetical protein